MKRILVPIGLVALIAAGLGVWLAQRPRPAQTPPEPAKAALSYSANTEDIVKAIRDAQNAARGGGAATVTSQGGQHHAASIALPGVNNVGVSINTHNAESSIELVFKTERPRYVSADAYRRIETGMAWMQVAGVLGGDMTKSQLGDGYTGGLAMVQGGGRIDLLFRDGKVVGKSSQGLE